MKTVGRAYDGIRLKIRVDSFRIGVLDEWLSIGLKHRAASLWVSGFRNPCSACQVWVRL